MSPLLFSLALKILTCLIRQDRNIKGITINDEEIKLTVFADDLTCLLQCKDSYYQLFKSLEVFARHSGLRVNSGKTELFAIGSKRLLQEELNHTVVKSIKILGIYFDCHKTSRKKANFDLIFQSVQKTLNMWKWRGLTLLGKIQIVKTFVIPRFMSKVPLIPVSDDLIKEINKLIYNFIWHGNEKIKRTALINDIEDGGLKMLDIESMISAQRVMVLKKYFDDNESSWKVILDEFLQGVGGKSILSCNFDTRKLPIHIPIFYRECLEAWSKLVPSTVNTYDDIVNQII